jgi:hypothetical protein
MDDKTVGTRNASTSSFDLDSFLEENNFLKDGKPVVANTGEAGTGEGAGTSDSIATRRRGAQNARNIRDAKKSDPNATMSYDALGEEYPEIPFADEDDSKTAVKRAARSASARPKASVTTGESSSTDAERGALPSAGDSPTAPARKARTRSTSTQTKKGRTGTSAPVKKQAGGRGTGKGRAPRLATFANPQDFHAAELTDNNYRIRGGGTRHNRRSPVMIALITVVVIIGVGLLAYALNNLYQTFMVEKADSAVVTLTSSETRSALDAEMPRVLGYIEGSPDDAFAAFVDNGWNVFKNDRATSDNPDRSSAGNEIVHLASGINEDVLKGYYESEFNAYSFGELQESFNGAWMLDLSRGDSGAYAQLKYVNFASTSLADEIKHLRGFQGLAETGAVVDSEGEDDWGNSYIQGVSTVGETKYYWKIVGIAFGEYYRGQDKRKLPDTAVFVKCTIASFDFVPGGMLFANAAEGEGSADGTDAEANGEGTETDTEGSGTEGETSE